MRYLLLLFGILLINFSCFLVYGQIPLWISSLPGLVGLLLIIKYDKLLD